MKIVLTTLFSLFSFSCLIAQGDLPKNQEPGKCYAKCMVLDEIESYDVTYPVYIGEINNEVQLKDISIKLKPEGTRWVKKKADKNCIPTSYEDCLVWCMIESPEEWVDITIVVDTSQTEDFVWETFTIQEKSMKLGIKEWKEVLCGDQVTSEIIMKVQHFLDKNGYGIENTTGSLDVRTKQALTMFQRHHHLPIGQLDIETLKKMKIQVW